MTHGQGGEKPSNGHVGVPKMREIKTDVVARQKRKYAQALGFIVPNTGGLGHNQTPYFCKYVDMDPYVNVARSSCTFVSKGSTYAQVSIFRGDRA